MAELVDAIDSKSVVREGVPVRVRLGAPFFSDIVDSQTGCACEFACAPVKPCSNCMADELTH